MSTRSLEDAIQEVGDPIEARRTAPGVTFPGIQLRGTSFTNWVDEQRAWEETCYVGDYSFTEEIRIDGPDALEFFKDVSVNSLRPLQRIVRSSSSSVTPTDSPSGTGCSIESTRISSIFRHSPW